MKIFKKIFSILLRIGISVILLFFLFRQVDKKLLFNIIKGADLGFLVFAFLIFFLVYVLCLLRWEMLLKGAHIHLSLKRVIISFAGGTFFNTFLPSTIGGDLVRSIDLATHTRQPHQVVATVLLDRLSGYTGLVILTLVAVALGFRHVQDASILLSVFIITAILVVILLLVFNRFLYQKINQLLHSPTAGKIRQAIKDLHQEMHLFRHHKEIIMENIILSLLIQAIVPVTYYILALALGIKLNLLYFFIFLPIIGAITLLPISIGGLGLRDTLTVFFFAKVGVAKDIAFAMSLLNFFFILVYACIGGLIYVLTVHHRRLPHHSPA
ncbi:MAG: flippase-like domain-containing protein [Candidatus Omnitrophica bacterium]|nr:flippase-like domain-containing protein [Candidatus Omnitrophota bacterium]